MPKSTAANNRARPRRVWSILRVVGLGLLLFAAFAVLGVLLNLLLSRFMLPEQAIILAFAACVGAGVVIAIWGMEGVVELQHSHVHNHLRKALTASEAAKASAAGRAAPAPKGKK